MKKGYVRFGALFFSAFFLICVAYAIGVKFDWIVCAGGVIVALIGYQFIKRW